ncbi:MAG: hypothetical protein AAGH88_13890 [Planctomycetota bacterium]
MLGLLDRSDKPPHFFVHHHYHLCLLVATFFKLAADPLGHAFRHWWQAIRCVAGAIDGDQINIAKVPRDSYDLLGVELAFSARHGDNDAVGL